MNVFLLFACVLQSCQSVPTKIGVITCDHCDTIGKVVLRVPNQDLKLLPPDSRNPIEISNEKPNHFFCRRGSRYKLTVTKIEKNQWIVDREFFAGESGLVVLDSNGKAVGLILGNRLVNGSWMGRVARFDSFVSAVVFAPNVPQTIRRTFLQLDTAPDSTPEFEAIESNPNASIPYPQPTVFQVFPNRLIAPRRRQFLPLQLHQPQLYGASSKR